MTTSQFGGGIRAGGNGEMPGLTGSAPGIVSGDAAVPGAGTMIRSEERLLIGTELVESGRVRVSRFIVTEDVTVTVRLRREEVRLEWLPAAESGDSTAVPHEPVRPDEFELILHAERPVVTREIVPVERVRLVTEMVTRNVAVTETLRKDRIDDPDIDVSAGAAR